MSKRVNITEEEKTDILNQYGIINEQIVDVIKGAFKKGKEKGEEEDGTVEEPIETKVLGQVTANTYDDRVEMIAISPNRETAHKIIQQEIENAEKNDNKRYGDDIIPRKVFRLENEKYKVIRTFDKL